MNNITIEFRILREDECQIYLKQWPNWNGVIPMIGDTVVLHYGDIGEHEVKYTVIDREISGNDNEKVVLIVETKEVVW